MLPKMIMFSQDDAHVMTQISMETASINYTRWYKTNCVCKWGYSDHGFMCKTKSFTFTYMQLFRVSILLIHPHSVPVAPLIAGLHTMCVEVINHPDRIYCEPLLWLARCSLCLVSQKSRSLTSIPFIWILDPTLIMQFNTSFAFFYFSHAE